MSRRDCELFIFDENKPASGCIVFANVMESDSPFSLFTEDLGRWLGEPIEARLIELLTMETYFKSSMSFRSKPSM